MIVLLDAISLYIIYILAIGLLLYATIWVYLWLFDYTLRIFRVKKEFLQWVREKYKPKVSTPKINRKERD